MASHTLNLHRHNKLHPKKSRSVKTKVSLEKMLATNKGRNSYIKRVMTATKYTHITDINKTMHNNRRMEKDHSKEEMAWLHYPLNKLGSASKPN